MDKPRHPLVVRPWKIRQTQPADRNTRPPKTEKERAPRVPTGFTGISMAKARGKASKEQT